MNEAKRPLWRIPAMWLVIGLPLLSIVAGVGLVIVATRTGGADPVRDDVRRVSQIQTTNLSADEMAREMGLSAVIRFDDGFIEAIPVTGAFDRQASLQLVLQHPTEARDDLRLELVPGENGWRLAHTLDESHDWVLELAPSDGHWRLHGRLPKQQHATRLAPSLRP